MCVILTSILNLKTFNLLLPSRPRFIVVIMTGVLQLAQIVSSLKIMQGLAVFVNAGSSKTDKNLLTSFESPKENN